MKLFQTIKKAILLCSFLLYFIEIQNVFGQDQLNITEYLSQKFRHYCELIPREEVFVSSDREEYISGEELWFNVWLVDRQSYRPSTTSKIVYLELLNPENKPVAQKRIGIDNGSGNGQIELPDTLSTGMYTIRAYTSRMKNFLSDNCFIKDIKIYNTLRATTFKKKIYVNDEIKSGSNRNDNILKTNLLFQLKANNLKPDSLEIFVYADNKYLSDNNDLFYLFIQTHGIINYVAPERINPENTKITVPKNLLIPGINQITFFNSKGEPVCESYIYTREISKPVISIQSADNFAKRSKVSFVLNIADSMSSGFDSANLCLSVTPLRAAERSMKLNEYLIFGSEFGLLPGKIIKDKNIDELPNELIDSILQNITSNWIDWRLILSGDLPEFKFPVETEDHYISGTLLTTDDQHANPGEFILLSIPGKTPLFNYARTNYEGKFCFSLHIDKETHDLIIQPDDADKNYKIYLDSPFSDNYLPSEINVDTIDKPVPEYLSKMSRNYQVEKIYGSTAAGIPSFIPAHSIISSKRFYGKPDAEIIMKDWVKLPGMEDVFFEIVPHIRLKKTESAYDMSLVDPFGNILYDSPPVMLIDGVIIKDPVKIVTLDPEQVEKIDVVKQQYMVGDYLFNGIVNVITASGNFNNIPIPDNSTRLEYRILDSALVFVSPDYSSSEIKNRHEPDFRNTLFWNPSIKPGTAGTAKLEFWTSDNASDYEICVQGITSKGKTLYIRKIIKVR